MKHTYQWMATGLICGAAMSPVRVGAEQPNIVVILADDLGWNAVGYHNPDVKTPNIDTRLLKEGVELNQFYDSPMCSPTRAGLLTGRYPIRYGCARSVIPPWRDFGLPVDEVMLQNGLEKAGYTRRGIFGKWHLGEQRLKWLPTRRGFTDFYGCYNGAVDYFTHKRENELDWHDGEESSHDKGYATRLLGKKATEFIREASEAKEPFFCYVPFTAPHGPLQVPGKDKEIYAHIENDKLQTYYAMITVMDTEIGRILDEIDKQGIADNTLVWFLSDNGGVRSIHRNNFPLNGSKLTSYDGGVRVVSCVRYPGHYLKGKQINERTAFIDVVPTLFSLAGITPQEAGCKPLDGVDLNPLLSGKTKELPERNLYFYHGQQGEDDEWMAVISKDWKLVANGPDVRRGRTEKLKLELYRLSQDPNETKDEAEACPEITDRLLKQLAEFRALQPENSVPPYNEGRKGFVAPHEWKITK